MYQNIVIPVEIGEAKSYEDAARVAAELLDVGGKVTLFHAIEPIPTYVTTYIPPEVTTRSKQEATQKLEAMAADLKIDESALAYGSAGRTIVDWADQNEVDCVIIKSHKPEFSDLFLGSTAAWVVRHTQTHVHVLR